jgi:CubicO group peptidase (beta-lactamase class C family)
VDVLSAVDGWGAEHVAAFVAGETEAVHGDRAHVFAWASVTKLLTGLAVLVAVEEGTVDLDERAGPPGSTVRHLLAHASGLGPEADSPLMAPERRRIYSNAGIEAAAELVADHAEMPFAEYFANALAPLGLRGSLDGSPAHAYRGPLGDLRALGGELLAPTLVAPETLAEATTVQFPGLAGVLPGWGRQDPNDWGLTLELRDAKAPHWMGDCVSPRSFGHFGLAGTFLWVDPELGLACGVLTDREFGDWAKAAWPPFNDAVVRSHRDR